jgi:Domain of unknown function (DUF6285)
MTEQPEAADLLDEARRSVLEILLPLLPQDRRYDGLMVANAIAIASREARLSDELLREAVRGLAFLLDSRGAADGSAKELRVTLQGLEQQLAQDLRRGAYDAPGPRRDAVRAYLRASTQGRVRLSNPKALGS